MKNLIILLMFVVLGAMNIQAQQTYQTFAADTVQGDTLVTTSEVDIKWDGFITWDYTCVGNATSDTVLIDFQGSNDSWNTYQTISTTTFIQGTTAANQHLVDDPAEYLNYRLTKRAYEIADTAIFTNKIYIYKR